ncbi:tyrosine-type recombinase/integrase [Streptomyces gobiensis]|uniref:tyrosine-type recombinase/integrase n=1 Tax=Streptomyces gobiensis TaxID=2875706 RepID=UPI001E520400|nr:site-specific integrase [Streptomyces gobiensis]UGY91303.1 tyrosine-type recombinase/integrase [Streptomyces gobiensis]
MAYRLYGEAPKANSVRTLNLSQESAEVLTQWRAKQNKAREEWSGVEAWVDSDRFFTHENGEELHPDWVSRRFKRLIELSGLPPVRLHDLRHISASLSLLQGNDIKVVQERLGHSSRQITSDTYTSVLPQLARREAESITSAIPRDVSYDVRQRLEIPSDAFRDDVAVIYAHGARYSGSRWSIGVKTRHDGDLLGEIRTTGRGPEHATNAAIKWIRDHCASAGFEVFRVDNLHDQYPEEERPCFTLVRFFIDRATGTGLEGWSPRPPAPDDTEAHEQDQKSRGKAA